MPTDLDLYSIFCTVARCGSLSHAARELYVSQPAISQSMHRLEYTLGCTLFTRTSRGAETGTGSSRAKKHSGRRA